VKLIELNGQPVSDGKVPLVCSPLVAGTTDELLAEAERVIEKGPDILEWRVDFFRGIADTRAVRETAARLRKAAGGLPVLFTCRSQREGGEPTTLLEEDVVSLYESICRDKNVDFVDFELHSKPANLAAVRQVARECAVKLVVSYHNFQATPGRDVLVEKFLEAEREGGDVAKVAVMPRSMRDVLTLLESTLEASERIQIPLISMSMGPMGALTRMCGWAFGSALTFAVGANSSAPGQMPVADVRAGVALLQKAGLKA
jgi:3-dehydroquinate dehydratase-1